MKSRLKAIKETYYNIPVQVRASFWFLVCSVMQRGISVLTTPIFTRILETGDYGQYTVFNSWLDIVSIFVTFRLYYGVFVQGLVKHNDDKDCYASSMQGLGLVLFLVWTIIYVIFHDFWNNLFKLTTVQMLAMLVMIWATGAFRFWAATQRNEYKYRLLVIVTFVVSILKPVVGVVLVIHSEDKATARILGLAIAEFIGYCWCFFVQMKRGKSFFSRQYWKHALMFNIPLIPHYLSQAVLSSSDRIMIRDMVGVSEAGIYGLAYSLSKLMSMINQALNQTFAPYAYRKIKTNKVTDISSIALVMLAAIAGANIILIAFAPELIAIFAPKTYSDAIWIIPPVAMSVYFTFAYSLFALVEFYYEKTRMIMLASIASAVLNILLNYIFISKYGYYAAGYTTLFCYIAYATFHYFFMKKICKTEMNDTIIYDSPKILCLSCGFVALGFIFLVSYDYFIIRYSIIIVMIVVCIIFRNEIIKQAKTILQIRKARKQN
ncbi:MAG: oligosaccharide flippase family protein [Eubacterium sp.]|nr:oligosaccharide flippase family protein [Eubacterium sp.]